MAQVSSQTELLAAVSAMDSSIEVLADFEISTQINIDYAVIISGRKTGMIHILKKSLNFNGSIFRIINGGSLTLENITLDGDKRNHPETNTANRTLILVTNGSLYLHSGTTIQNNNAYLEGGGVYISGSPSYSNQFVMDGNAVIQNCSSLTSGGGIMAAIRNSADSITITQNAVIQNNTARNGGGIYFRIYTADTSGTLSIGDSVKISGNTARNGNGGGIYFSNLTEGNSVPVRLTIFQSAVISSNFAVNGAGIYFIGTFINDTFILSDSGQIIENTAIQYGGGICLSFPLGKANVFIEGGFISRNIGGTGGGIYFITNSGGVFHASDTTIMENTANNGASGSGGGLWLNNTSAFSQTSVLISNSFIRDNSASALGGGIHYVTGNSPFSFTVTNSAISGNSAQTNGGGLFMGSAGGGNIKFTDSRISQNKSGNFGGGYYFANSTENAFTQMEFTNTIITQNHALQQGGGLRLTSNLGVLTTTISDCTISSNTAELNSGGGIWNGGADASLTLLGTTRIENNETITGNGGGIYFNSESGILLLRDETKILSNHADAQESSTGNHGGGICVVPGNVIVTDNTEIAFNSALKYGGGLSMAQASNVSIEGGMLHDNESNLFGGGIYSTNAVLHFMQGSIFNNLSQIGGGIYNSASAQLYITQKAEIDGNKATQYAAGIYNAGLFFTEGDRNILNGLYIENRNAAARIEKALTEGSAIQLNCSVYVTPNPEGRPIVVAEATQTYPVLTQTDTASFLKPPIDFDGWEIRLYENNTQIVLIPEQYTIIYENLMESYHLNPTQYTVTSPDIVLSEPYPVSGYIFSGWFDAPERGTQITVIPHGSTGNKILYAHWEIIPLTKHTIFYHANDSDCPAAHNIPDPLIVEDTQTAVLSSKIPTRDGYLFTKWNTQPNGSGSSFQPAQSIPNVIQDINLYAQWIVLSKPSCCCCCYCC